MSSTDVCRGVEQNGAGQPCLIMILEKFGYRVFIIRRRLSRLTMRIQRAEKKNQPTTTFESEKEGLLDELARYEDLLNDCAEWIRVRTGIPTNELVEVAISTAFTEGEDRDHIYAELRKLDERGVTAELWRALVSRGQDALLSVKLFPASESSPTAGETGGKDGVDKRKGQTDTPKKTERKLRRRLLDVHAKACIKEFKQYRKLGEPQSMREIVKEYVATHAGVSESGTYRRLTDNRDQWAT